MFNERESQTCLMGGFKSGGEMTPQSKILQTHAYFDLFVPLAPPPPDLGNLYKMYKNSKNLCLK